MSEKKFLMETQPRWKKSRKTVPGQKNKRAIPRQYALIRPGSFVFKVKSGDQGRLFDLDAVESQNWGPQISMSKLWGIDVDPTA
jgi:hypothetical protein